MPTLLREGEGHMQQHVKRECCCSSSESLDPQHARMPNRPLGQGLTWVGTWEIQHEGKGMPLTRKDEFE